MIQDRQMEAKEKRQMIDLLSILASELTVTKDQRRSLSPIIENIGRLANTATSVAALWKALEPLLSVAFP